ncbi:hypothetical protein CDG76_19210 [Nostoc sp. 'Peltigera membranacea cyanobiont' 210A]|uniref:bacteriocin n=1 Tax=Nostoc sp. 'Peltigera membranacea cyanobiont' 210A TaxID=2014529 RepID=UPI000B954FF5|nr:bacteriocin [Nostoc sp. 'Peltigera membranacea cyanobiont' 210A]OYD92853.1 hypothetical protein CDG76_19210 [Nostoc sp. 'Peltigera membranacea cyanobiont' 210A]
MATIKISELQPESQFEKLSDADLQAINGGGNDFQFVITGSSAVTGVNASPTGRIQNGTNSFFTLNAGAGSPFVNASLTTNGFSQSFPS